MKCDRKETWDYYGKENGGWESEGEGSRQRKQGNILRHKDHGVPHNNGEKVRAGKVRRGRKQV